MSSDADKLKTGPDRRGEAFASLWSRRKSEALSTTDASSPASKLESARPLNPGQQAETAAEQPTDADMPPLETLGDDSDYSGFMSPKVSEELRAMALRKLFHLPKFNVTDGLNDYDEDYTSFAKLGSVQTHEMRRLNELREKLAATGDEKEGRNAQEVSARSGVSDSSQTEEADVSGSQVESEGTEESSANTSSARSPKKA